MPGRDSQQERAAQRLLTRYGGEYWATLCQAYDNAPIVEVAEDGKTVKGELEARAEELKRFEAFPDVWPIWLGGESKSAKTKNRVAVSKPYAYRRLLGQAMVLTGLMAGEVEDPAEEVRVVSQHEKEHASVVRSISPQAIVRYCVEYLKSEVSGSAESIAAHIAPQVIVHGYLRKVDVAYVSMSVANPSPSDLITMQALGYESFTEVQKARETVGNQFCDQIDMANRVIAQY